jgi:hypothetical protein
MNGHHVFSMRSTTVAISSAALVLTAAACGGSGGSSASSGAPSAGTSTPAHSAAGGIPCSQAGDLAATPQLQPPPELPIVPGGHVYLSKGPFGKTKLFFEALAADPANLDGPRDRAAAELVKAGWTLDRKDQEEGSEAEAHLSRKDGSTVAIQVIQLCDGMVRIKYTLG